MVGLWTSIQSPLLANHSPPQLAPGSSAFSPSALKILLFSCFAMLPSSSVGHWPGGSGDSSREPGRGGAALRPVHQNASVFSSHEILSVASSSRTGL